MSTFYPGAQAGVSFASVPQPLDEWSLSVNGERTEVSRITEKFARYRTGNPTFEVNAAGPYSWLNLYRQGDTVDVMLTLAPGLAWTVNVRVVNVRVDTQVRGVAKVQWNFVVNEDVQDPQNVRVIYF